MKNENDFIAENADVIHEVDSTGRKKRLADLNMTDLMYVLFKWDPPEGYVDPKPEKVIPIGTN